MLFSSAAGRIDGFVVAGGLVPGSAVWLAAGAREMNLSIKCAGGAKRGVKRGPRCTKKSEKAQKRTANDQKRRVFDTFLICPLR